MKSYLRSPMKTGCIVLLLLTLFTRLSVYGKSAKPEDEKLKFTCEWEIRGNVNKLFDTPMGEVYDFTMSDYYNFSYKYFKDTSKKNVLNSIQFDLQKFMDRREKIRRFIVLDFKVRTFPAIILLKNPTLTFALTRSAADPANISNYQNLNGISRYESEKVWHIISPPLNSPLWCSGKSLDAQWSIDMEKGCFPYYEVNVCRVIFDTYKGGITSTNINADKLITPHLEETSGLIIPTRSLGLCIQINEDIIKKPYRQLIEVSLPSVTLTDREEVLRDLPPLEPWAAYPYGGYAEELKKLKMTNNPDLIYACAMRFLEGQDLSLGVELLKKAAVKQHIFAMYQLGVCYYRGIGVEPDLKKSLEWLTHATEYDMPDAWALYGVVQMRSTQSPYLNDYVRSSIRQSINALDNYTVKHDNCVIAELFNNGSYHILPRYITCSPRLLFLTARLDYLFPYYKNNVDPKLLPPPPKAGTPPPSQPKIKNPLNFDNSTFKKPPAKTRTTPDIATAQDLTDHKLPNKYYDIRVEGIFCQENANEWFKSALEENYIPAILYHGRLILAITEFSWTVNGKELSPSYFGEYVSNTAEALEKAAAIFDKGAKLGSLECEVEALHCRVRLGTVKKEDFTPELNIRLADYPLYHMLKYMVDNQDAPGVKEFLSRKYEDARQIWRSNPTAWNNFLLGAEALYQYYNYGFDTAWYRLYYRDIKDVETAFKYLDIAAKQNIAPALYLCGKQFLEGMRSKGQLDEVMHKKIGTDLLKAAEQAGYAKASYLLTKQQLITNIYSTDEKWLEKLKPLLEAKDADSWLLAGDIYSRLKSSGSDKKTLDAYGKAAELGSIRAWHALGMRYYNKPAAGKEKEQNKLKASEYWQKFVKLDREARSQDINDVYWPNIKKPQVFKLGDGDYSMKGLSDKDVRRYYETY